MSEEKYTAGFTRFLKKKKSKAQKDQISPDSLLHFTLFPNAWAWKISKYFFSLFNYLKYAINSASMLKNISKVLQQS